MWAISIWRFISFRFLIFLVVMMLKAVFDRISIGFEVIFFVGREVGAISCPFPDCPLLIRVPICYEIIDYHFNFIHYCLVSYFVSLWCACDVLFLHVLDCLQFLDCLEQLNTCCRTAKQVHGHVIPVNCVVTLHFLLVYMIGSWFHRC